MVDVQSPESNEQGKCESNAEFSFFTTVTDVILPKFFALTYFIIFTSLVMHQCLTLKLNSREMPQARATFQEQRDSSGNSPLADPGWTPSQKNTSASLGPQLSLNEMLRT